MFPAVVPSAALSPSFTTPCETVNAPEKVFTPFSVSVSPPIFEKVVEPETMPLKVMSPKPPICVPAALIVTGPLALAAAALLL